MELGKTSIFVITDTLSAAGAVDLAHRVESAGYGALWVPETFGREVLGHASFLLSNTKRLTIATGIANIYARDPRAMASGQLALNEQSGNRFLLGIGVSHSFIVSDMRGHNYGKPVATMRAYLEAMKLDTYTAPKPTERPKTIIAALRPKMLELTAEMADGAIPYAITAEHTERARKILGPNKLLCPVQNVMLETDPATARAGARAHVGLSLSLPNYQNNLKWIGFKDEDFENGCSDRLIDAMVAWGDEDAIRKRIDLHFAAGADHVCIQPMHSRPRAMGDIEPKLIELLAPNRR